MRATILMLTLAAAASASACKGEKTDDTSVKTETADGMIGSATEGATEARGTSLVRMINALPTGGGATVSADDRPLFSSVDYKTVTPYAEVRDNITRFRLVGTGLDTTIASNNEIMMDGSRYTVLALPEADGKVRLRVLNDKFDVDSTKARLRVVHGVSGVGEIDIALLGRNDDLFENVNPTSEAGFADVNIGTATVVVKLDGSGTQVIRKEIRFEAGHSYTLVLTGGAAKGSTQRVEAVVVDDRVSTSDGGSMSMGDTSKRGER
jgi:hypothetical protein